MARAGQNLPSSAGRIGARPGQRHVAELPVRARCLVMGVLNVTPDSFSDGGRHLTPARAIDRGLTLAAQGADIVDVAGESTRPGAEQVPGREELHRVLHVATHWRPPAGTCSGTRPYGDMRTELRRRLDELMPAGVDLGRIIPGLGFEKTPRHNRELLARLDELRAIGWPLPIGTSRKSLLGQLLADGDTVPSPRAPGQRHSRGLALSALADVSCLRVHDLPGTIRDTGSHGLGHRRLVTRAA